MQPNSVSGRSDDDFGAFFLLGFGYGFLFVSHGCGESLGHFSRFHFRGGSIEDLASDTRTFHEKVELRFVPAPVGVFELEGVETGFEFDGNETHAGIDRYEDRLTVHGEIDGATRNGIEGVGAGVRDVDLTGVDHGEVSAFAEGAGIDVTRGG